MTGGNDLKMRIRKRVTASQLEANRRNSSEINRAKDPVGKSSFLQKFLETWNPQRASSGNRRTGRRGCKAVSAPCSQVFGRSLNPAAHWRTSSCNRSPSDTGDWLESTGAEAGEIAKNSESVEYNFADCERQSVAECNPHLMRKSSRGLERFSATLDLAELELKLVGYLPISRSRDWSFALGLK